MYLKIITNLSFLELGALLEPGSTADSLEHDYENRYEWMYLSFEDGSFTLNISRDHGWPDETKRPNPGPTYICVHEDKEQILFENSIQNVAQWIANCVNVDVEVYSGPLNVDVADGDCLRIVSPA